MSKAQEMRRMRQAVEKASRHMWQVFRDLQSSCKGISERLCSQEAGIDLSFAVFEVVSCWFSFSFPHVPVAFVLQRAPFQATQHMSAAQLALQQQKDEVNAVNASLKERKALDPRRFGQERMERAETSSEEVLGRLQDHVIPSSY